MIARPDIIIICTAEDGCVVTVDGEDMFAGTRAECNRWADDLLAEWSATFDGLYAPERERISA